MVTVADPAFQIVHRPGGTYHPVRDMAQSTAIVVIPAGCRHELVDDRFQMFVTQGQVTPGLHAETGGIDMHVKPAAPVHFHVTQVEHPADLLQLPQPCFADKDRTDQLEGVVSVYTAVRHEFPMRTGGMVVTFHRNLDIGLPELACEPFTGAVVSLDLDTELAVESVIRCGCQRLNIRTALTFPHPAQGIHYKAVVSVGHHSRDFRTGNTQKIQLPDLARLCRFLY